MFEGLQLTSLPGLAGVLEVFGGLLILIGLFTRPVAFVLCGFMAVAYFMAHGSQGNVLLPMLNGGELAVLYCFVFLYLVFAGAGAWSVDALRHGARAGITSASRAP
jgi:putative oxidoreductase